MEGSRGNTISGGETHFIICNSNLLILDKMLEPVQLVQLSYTERTTE
jgi:hypothetical protein